MEISNWAKFTKILPQKNSDRIYKLDYSKMNHRYFGHIEAFLLIKTIKGKPGRVN